MPTPLATSSSATPCARSTPYAASASPPSPPYRPLQLRRTLRQGLPPGAEPGLMRRLREVTDLPWDIATGEDVRLPTAANRPQALFGSGPRQVDRLAPHGNLRAHRPLDRIYQLMGTPASLLHPALLAATRVAAPATGTETQRTDPPPADQHHPMILGMLAVRARAHHLPRRALQRPAPRRPA